MTNPINTINSEELDNCMFFNYWANTVYYQGPVLHDDAQAAVFSVANYYETYSGGLSCEVVQKIIILLKNFCNKNLEFILIANDILFVLRSMKDYYMYSEFADDEEINLAEFRKDIQRAYWSFVCIFNNDRMYLNNLQNNFGISFETLESFINLCTEYSKKGLEKMNMKELVEYFLKRKNFKPFFVFYYDQEVSKVMPWITQVIFVHHKTHMFVRISYDDFKFGLFKTDPFYYDNGTLRFIRERWNEAGKYCEGFLIPPTKGKGWMRSDIAEDLLFRCHYKIKPMDQGPVMFELPKIINNQTAIFDPKKALEIKNVKKELF